MSTAIPTPRDSEAEARARRLEQLLRELAGNNKSFRVTPREYQRAEAVASNVAAPAEAASAGEAGSATGSAELPRSPASVTPTAEASPLVRGARWRPRPVRAGAAPAAQPAPLTGLGHLSEQARGKLQGFLSGKAERTQPAAAAVEPAPSVRPSGQSELKAALAASRSAFMATGVFSLVINILMLAGPLFMLQVYDRVMTSGSVPTLLALSALTAAVYGIIGLLELIRSRIITRVGVDVDQRIGNRVFEAALRRSLISRGLPQQALRELDNLRNFVAGPGPVTLFDAPWTPVYLAVIFLLSPWLGLAALVGAAILLVLAIASETRSRQPLGEATKATLKSMELAETGQRNAEAILAMGMLQAYRAQWQKANQEALAWQVISTDRLGSVSSTTKAVRLLLQSMMLAIGAWLAIKNEISAGTIVAATIIFGRALAPVEQAISQWRTFVKAKASMAKLDELLTKTPPAAARTRLPPPRGVLEVTSLRVAAPETRQLILAGLSFAVQPGQVLAVVGPSASGKSTLVRALVGLWEPFSGTIKLDGATLDQWSPDDLGRHLGYLPQDVELFAGTVRQNIARFRDDAEDAEVIDAARMAHAHDMILGLPKGYDTELGAFGMHLSAGQRQRIALARALFGDPPMVVLDEPNANLDRVGDDALSAAIDGCRKRGQAVVLVSHRVQAIGKADLLLYIEKGQQKAFGPRNDVMKQLQPPNANPAGDERRGTASGAAKPAAAAAAGAAARPVPAKPQGSAA